MQGTHERALKALDRRGRLRALSPRHGLDFSSNDYLGLARSGALREAAEAALDRGVAVGATGSRLLRGNDEEHEALESEAARFFRGEACLFFAQGFMANYAVFATLPARDDLVVYDALIHASIHDGMRASRATCVAVPHNNAGAFDDAIQDWHRGGGRGQVWLAVESLYSMDGDRAPLEDLFQIAQKNDGLLVIDEAHATGVWGSDGRGLAANLEGKPNVITVHTCGKALGVMGGLVVLPSVYRDFLINRARAFIYATAPSPLVAAVVRHALWLCKNEPDRRTRLLNLIAHAGRELADKTDLAVSGSQIQPVIAGTDARATAIASNMMRRGFDVRAVRPPTVPEGTSRLRVSLTLNVDESDVSAMAAALAEELARPSP